MPLLCLPCRKSGKKEEDIVGAESSTEPARPVELHQDPQLSKQQQKALKRAKERDAAWEAIDKKQLERQWNLGNEVQYHPGTMQA